MQLSHEIDRIFTRLHAGHVDPEVASRAVEQLISAHVRKPWAQLDHSIRSALERMRFHAADLVAAEAEIMAWLSLRTDADHPVVVWL